jgi:hypothetical protein
MLTVVWVVHGDKPNRGSNTRDAGTSLSIKLLFYDILVQIQILRH